MRIEILDYTETSLGGIASSDERKHLWSYVIDNDAEVGASIEARGYTRDPSGDRPLAKFDIPGRFPVIRLPEGFRLKSLADDPDWAKAHRVIWRGFDHGDDVPMDEEEFESCRRMFDTPSTRLELKIVVEAPDGDFVSFCGVFFEPIGRFS